MLEVMVDSEIFASSRFGQELNSDTLDIPSNTFLPDLNIPFPYVFVGDEAFPIRKDLMRPYPGRDLDADRIVFNYRLSRARRVVKNAFGVLSARWRILRRPIEADPTNVDKIVCATVILHNFCLENATKNEYISTSFIDSEIDGQVNPGEWRASSSSSLKELRKGTCNHASSSATDLWNTWKEFFVSEGGRVLWQENVLNKGRVLKNVCS